MEHVRYVYTFGMDESELKRKLRETETGVLSLARADDAYATPVSFHYDGKRVLLRLGIEEDSEKRAFIETTDRASFTVYDATADYSWSILLTGALHPVAESFSDTEINERFAPLRVFGEDIATVEPAIYELKAEQATGRKT